MLLSVLNLIKSKQSNAAKSYMADTAQCWTVYVDSNYQYMNEDERYSVGSFESYDDALLACQKIVDEFLISSKAKTADDLFKGYVSFGEDPWIKGADPNVEKVYFSAHEYARQRCGELLP